MRVVPSSDHGPSLVRLGGGCEMVKSPKSQTTQHKGKNGQWEHNRRAQSLCRILRPICLYWAEHAVDSNERTVGQQHLTRDPGMNWAGERRSKPWKHGFVPSRTESGRGLTWCQMRPCGVHGGTVKNHSSSAEEFIGSARGGARFAIARTHYQ